MNEKSGEELLAAIRPNAADYGPLAFRALIGGIPVIGAPLAAAVEAIPGQRLDRVVECVEYIHGLVKAHEASLLGLEKLFAERAAPQRAQLVRVGLTAAADALSSERVRTIAGIVTGGLLEGEAKAQELTRVLRSIEPLDDVELSVLGEVVRFGNIGLIIEGDTPHEQGYELTSSVDGEFPGLPVALSTWNVPQLYLVLGHLSSAGMLEAGSAVVLDGRTRKFFQSSPMGRLLYEELTAQEAPAAQPPVMPGVDGGTF